MFDFIKKISVGKTKTVDVAEAGTVFIRKPDKVKYLHPKGDAVYFALPKDALDKIRSIDTPSEYHHGGHKTNVGTIRYAIDLAAGTSRTLPAKAEVKNVKFADAMKPIGKGRCRKVKAVRLGDNQVFRFDSITEAANALDVSVAAINSKFSRYEDADVIVKSRDKSKTYYFTKLK